MNKQSLSRKRKRRRVEDKGKQVDETDDAVAAAWSLASIDVTKSVVLLFGRYMLIKNGEAAEPNQIFVERFLATRIRGETKPIAVDRVWVPAGSVVDQAKPFFVPPSISTSVVDGKKAVEGRRRRPVDGRRRRGEGKKPHKQPIDNGNGPNEKKREEEDGEAVSVLREGFGESNPVTTAEKISEEEELKLISVERDLVTRRKKVEREYGLFFPSRRLHIILTPDLIGKPIDPEPIQKFLREDPVYNAPHWPDIIKNDRVGWARRGQTLDVTALFARTGTHYLVTNHGSKVRVDSLHGCYVILACFLVPVISEFTSLCRTLIAISHDLPKRGIDNCKIVISAKMRQNLDNDKADFDHFFSGFPASFLAIPFADSASRDYVAYSLHLSSYSGGIAVLVIDPETNVYPQEVPKMISYGATSFPFDPEAYKLRDRLDQALQRRLDSFSPQPGADSRHLQKPGVVYDRSPISLAELLGYDSEDLALFQIPGLHDTKAAPVSALDGKLVLLYLCFNGGFMERLYELQQEVKNKHPQLEIVLVPLSFKEDSEVFLEHVTLALQELQISSWWTFPYNDSLSRTLWRISGEKYYDRLIILPYGKQFSGEILAHAVITLFGSRVYPFTREQLYSERLSALLRVDLISLLRQEKQLSRYDLGLPPIPVDDLQGRNILLHLDTFQSRSHYKTLSDLLHEHWNEILLAHSNICIIHVPMNGKPDHEIMKTHAGLYLPPECAESVCEALILEDLGEMRMSGTLVSVADDGRICSRKAEKFLYKDGIKHLFKCILELEIAADVDCEVKRSDF